MTKIAVDYNTFIAWFPYFTDKATEESVSSAYEGAASFISTNLGNINLPGNLQTRGVYLATAHVLFLSLNPTLASAGKVASATEGSVSASFTQPQYKNWLEYWLSLSPYGMELLAILAQVQPPLPRRRIGAYPYYQGGFGVQR